VRVAFVALLFAVSTAVHAMDFATLQSMLAASDITTVEALVEALPAPLRTNYVLVFQSRSLQGASLANPRAILFGNDATLVVTFNGDAGQRGNAAVETMEFDARTSTFQFREIGFGAPGTPPSISAPNPQRCTACHGTPAHPIWDTPPSWPGAYGEHYRSGLSPQEEAGMREFLALQPRHPRYGFLLAPGRFARRDSYVTSSAARYNDLATEPPNARLSTLLTELNARAILAALVARPAFASHRYALLAAAEGSCGPLEDSYPPAMRTSLSVQLRDFQASFQPVEHRQELDKLGRLRDHSALRSHGEAPLDLGPLRFVAERGLGAGTGSWTLALEHDTYDLAAPAGTWSLRDALRALVIDGDDELAGLRDYRSFDAGDRYCRLLRERSRRALEDWYATGARATPAAGDVGDVEATPTGPATPRALARCANCHTGEIAPRIPFADAAALAPLLVRGDYRHGRLLDEIRYRLSDTAGADRMPRGALMTQGDAQALADYFGRLALSPQP
jgi:mono/diheme cytochrome c family protein